MSCCNTFNLVSNNDNAQEFSVMVFPILFSPAAVNVEFGACVKAPINRQNVQKETAHGATLGST